MAGFVVLRGADSHGNVLTCGFLFAVSRAQPALQGGARLRLRCFDRGMTPWFQPPVDLDQSPPNVRTCLSDDDRRDGHD
jgi:hypothetical protein